MASVASWNLAEILLRRLKRARTPGKEDEAVTCGAVWGVSRGEDGGGSVWGGEGVGRSGVKAGGGLGGRAGAARRGLVEDDSDMRYGRYLEIEKE